MFKKMRRFKQQISKDKCVEILTNEPHGVLSLISDTGYPCGFPITHWYDEKTGHIYFHGAKEGHKIDCLKQCDKASFCVMDKGFKKDGEWANVIKLRNDGFEENTKNVLLFFLWKI